MPRPKSLTTSALAAATLAVLDRDGLAALSMRAVAAELGMGTMSLYRYVADRDALEALAVEHMMSRVDTAPPKALWDKQIAVLVERIRAAIAAHPNAVPLTMAHRHRCPSLLRWSESVLEVLTRAGFTGEQRVIALRALLAYLIGATEIEHRGPLSSLGTEAMAAMDEYPLLAETAATARTITLDIEFRRGLDVVLSGLRRP
ncbi:MULTISPECIES: TetR/AcrR family transcriptional regulator C-terminal domain-containing protein [Saccharothrix]|uniref:TetR/AcrR family transcriptional regulator C-terminal domain-containing protein n=1 Tax=Saccharothrix TaxID=2071 RepID=UPI00093E0960|nr:TetR/AcrR family transcriptional regulator C-terminal domain-containing protein [Saccharothrix sp. CB00851]OKI36264.1 transcriptional regulator [Saccharothrix sp. CB00851]